MAVIMCPGGGYSRLAMDHEGHDMAPWFCGQGITYIVLKYRMPNGHCEVPLSDAERAIRIVREHAGEWNINPRKIGIMGASAGGHLASTPRYPLQCGNPSGFSDSALSGSYHAAKILMEVREMSFWAKPDNGADTTLLQRTASDI